MKYKDFRNFKIKRTCNEKFDNYKKYRPYLEEDFHHRCAYCNTSDQIIEYFSIDHYVPRNIFEKIDDTLDIDYNNLMYSCMKCNRSKGKKYERRDKKISR